MMARPTAMSMAVFAILTNAITPALSGNIGPVCREPSVVDEMAREIKSAYYYTHVDPRLVTEQPTADPRIVHCQVCVQATPYDMLRFRDRPIQQCTRRDFDVQILSNGFVVQHLP
jgi:hypothetical protein